MILIVTRFCCRFTDNLHVRWSIFHTESSVLYWNGIQNTCKWPCFITMLYYMNYQILVMSLSVTTCYGGS